MLDSTVHDLLRDSSDILREAGVDTPILDSEVMLAHALACTRTELIAHPERHPSQEEVACFARQMERRARREPLAYILGEKEFYGISFEVSPAVLIPRPETEILVEVLIDHAGSLDSPRIADIGVGSGAVAVSLAKSLPSAVVYGTDVSDAALEVAGRNAERACVKERVRLLKGDLLDPLAGMEFDLIVSNPPYIPSGEVEGLPPEIAKFEPRESLDGGPDGLHYYRRLTAEGPKYLEDEGLLAVEAGIGQADSVKKLFEEHGLHDIRAVRDYGGVERVVLGRKCCG